MSATRYERLAQELILRVRDDDPAANGRWWDSLSEEDRRGVAFVLAAAVPDDRSWSELIAWTQTLAPKPDPEWIERRRRQWREAQHRRVQRRRAA